MSFASWLLSPLKLGDSSTYIFSWMVIIFTLLLIFAWIAKAKDKAKYSFGVLAIVGVALSLMVQFGAIPLAASVPGGTSTTQSQVVNPLPSSFTLVPGCSPPTGINSYNLLVRARNNLFTASEQYVGPTVDFVDKNYKMVLPATTLNSGGAATTQRTLSVAPCIDGYIIARSSSTVNGKAVPVQSAIASQPVEFTLQNTTTLATAILSSTGADLQTIGGVGATSSTSTQQTIGQDGGFSWKIQVFANATPGGQYGSDDGKNIKAPSATGKPYKDYGAWWLDFDTTALTTYDPSDFMSASSDGGTSLLNPVTLTNAPCTSSLVALDTADKCYVSFEPLTLNNANPLTLSGSLKASLGDPATNITGNFRDANWFNDRDGTATYGVANSAGTAQGATDHAVIFDVA